MDFLALLMGLLACVMVIVGRSHAACAYALVSISYAILYAVWKK